MGKFIGIYIYIKHTQKEKYVMMLPLATPEWLAY